MRITTWKRLPSDRILIDDSILHELPARSDKHGNVGAKISALMLYIAIGLCAEEEEEGESSRFLRASPTYDELQNLTGLSRPLISTALSVLEGLQLIERKQKGRSVVYQLTGYNYGKGWCKVPCRALSKRVGERVQIEPFLHFSKRARVELHALKMFLYLLAIRNNNSAESEVSYDTIAKRTGIPRKDIRKAGTFLFSSGLLSNIKKSGYQDSGESEHEGGANKYYVTGFKDLLIR
jgi:DNA-binding transcriptional ArsR family regulator